MGDISQLPEDLIHHILSYITTTEACQVSIFCKTWYNAWLTRPTLDFIDDYYEGENGKYKFINKTLLRYQEQKIPIVQLKLPLGSSASHVNKWLRIAAQNGVKRLDVVFLNRIDQPTLLRTISEAGSLRELSLGGKIRQLDGRVIFNHLSTLNLRDIHNIYDDRFQAIIAKCPFIENLCVEDCEGLKSIKVCTLYNLKKFTVRATRYRRYNVDVEIEAPNLQFLQVEIFCGSLKLYKTENLICLTLVGNIDLPLTFLDNWEYKYPQVENLNLLGLEGHTRMSIPSPSVMRSISSPSLKRVVLKNLEELNIEIEAPNLQFLQVEMHSGSLKLYKTEKLICLSLVGDIALPSTFFNKWEQDYPQVENLTLLGLKGHMRMSLSSHSLKRIVLKNLEEANIEIEAPNLQLLEVKIHSGSLKLYTTEKLLCLSLVGNIDLPSTFLYYWEQEYPQLVLNCEDLREVYIDNPNLMSLELSRITVFPELFLTNTQTEMVLKIFVLDCPQDTNQFCKLKQFLARWIHYKISLYLELTSEGDGFVYVEKISTCPKVQVDDLTLNFKYYSTKLLDSNFLEALFLTCHPKSLLVEGSGDLVLFITKKLIEKRNGERASWCNELKRLRIDEVYNKTILNMLQLSGRKSLVNRPYYWTKFKACYMLTWK